MRPSQFQPPYGAPAPHPARPHQGPPQAYPVPAPPGARPPWAAPAAHPPPAPYAWQAPAAVIDVGKADSRRFVIGSVVSGALGLTAIIAGLAGAVEGGPGVAIAAVAIGAVFLLVGLLPLLARKQAFRPRRLVIEPAGIRWDDPRGSPWAVPWPELAAVSLTRHGALQVGPESVSDKVAGAMADRMVGERVVIRLDLVPADAGFHQRHPEMAHLWEEGRLRLRLGQNAALVPRIGAAMRQFQPALYRGVQETRGFMGLG